MSDNQVEQILSAVENMALVAPPKPNKKVIVPPMWFNLVKISNCDMLSHISYLTNHFCDLPPDLVTWIINDSRTRPCSYYGSIPAPPSTDLTKQIIGISGYYLKLTTQNCGVDFIWHNRERNEFQFWGGYNCCVNAMNAIRYRICKYVEQAVEKSLAEKARLGQLPEEQEQEQEPVKQEPVFLNDIDPNPAVCLEAIIQRDENGEFKNIVAKKSYE